MVRTTLAIIVALVASSEGFVPRSTVGGLSRQAEPLKALDPSHLFEGASTFLADASNSDVIPGTSGEVTYSRASYYTILGLYLTSFPGLWSTIKRSTSAKVKRKTYVT